ncbi:hypothetical protein ABK040_004806 [Willaertia magna]
MLEEEKFVSIEDNFLIQQQTIENAQEEELEEKINVTNNKTNSELVFTTTVNNSITDNKTIINNAADNKHDLDNNLSPTIEEDNGIEKIRSVSFTNLENTEPNNFIKENDEHNNDNNNNNNTENIVKKITPLPYKKLFIVFFLYLCDNLNMTSLFPYIAYMISDFNITNKPEEYGYYIGFIAGSYYLSQFISSFIWGHLSDHFGRRPILLFGVFISSFIALGFGFSKYYWYAIVVRFLFGLFNGNLGVMKSYLGEITDSTNQAKAFSFIGVTFGISSVLGPLIGGVLSRPTKQYPNFLQLFPQWIQLFLDKFPYLLPNLIVSGVAFIGFILGYLYLEESAAYLSRKEQKKNNIINNSESQQNLLNDGIDRNVNDELEEEIIVQNYNNDKKKSILFNNDWKEKCKEMFINFKNNEILKSPIPLITCFMYMFLGFKQVIFDECLPLFTLLPVDKGGFGWNSYELGMIGAFLGSVIFVGQVFIIHRVITKYGCLRCYRIVNFINPFLILLFPELSIFASTKEDQTFFKTILLWSITCILLLFYQITLSFTFLGTFVITNNCVTRKNAGKLNGIAQSLVSLSRMFGPVLGGTIFAWSVNFNVFPLDRRFIYYLLVIVSFILFGLSFLLNHEINIPKDEIVKKEEEE